MSNPTVLEPARSVPVAYEADVCVIGGSCTGVFAAVAAARRGARVALVEAQGMLGGTATSGLVAVWHSLLDTRFERQIIAGLTAEAVERLDRRGALTRRGRDANLALIFSPAELALELDRLAAEAGVRVFLHARFAAPVVEDGRVAAAVIEDKSGRRAIRARFFVDASGDGDLIDRAGLATRSMGDLQPPTTCAVLRGLAVLKERNPGFSINRAVFDPKLEGALECGFLWTADLPLGPDMTLVAGTRVNGADCSDADQLTHAEQEGRAQVRRIVDLLRKNFAGGEELRLAALPGHIGVRQTRQIVGRHRLTEQEVLAGTRFPDAIANGSYRVDVHHNDRAGITFRYLDGREVFIRADGTDERRRWRPEQSEDPTFYQVPYRSLVPEGSRNVLAAGRLVDADRGAFGAVRVMVNCNQTGEAAGAAAALALDSGRDAGEVDTAKLRKELATGGAAVV
ncbi:MAG TPA: FAD-dependent oxidoreductase [Planctomycetota bacterium]|nr:FAD-dependent oxidoreductase [Planctomycetota bacterium]